MTARGTWFAILPFFSAILSCATMGAEHSRPKPDSGAEVLPSPRSLPLKIYRNFLVVAEGQFGEASGVLNFILDTGTAPSIMNRRVVRESGLKTTASSMAAVGKTVATEMAVVPEIRLGPIRANGVPVQVQDLSQVEGDFGVSIAGIIGLDVLARCSFRIDYERKEITFGKVAGKGISVAYDARYGVAVAQARLGGKTARLLVDTGSDRLVLLGGNFGKEELRGLRNTLQEAASLAEHTVRVQVFLAPEVVLGGEHFTVDRGYYLPGSTDPQFDGLLGVRALGFRAVAYDQTRAQLYLQR